MGSINAIILGGGVSSRFDPLEKKNLFQFLGKSSFDIHVEQLKGLDLKKIFIITNSKNDLGCPGVEVLEQKGSGMAAAILTALEDLNLEEEILILNADDFYDNSLISDFSKLRPELLNRNEAALTGYETKKYFPGGYMVVKDDFITNINEKPGEGNEPSKYVAIVFDYFPKGKVLKEYLKNTKSEKDDVFEVALNDMMKSEQKFRMLPYKGEWKTIKYPWHVLDVMDFFLENIKGQNISLKADISPGAYIKGNVIIEEGVKIFDGAVINGPVYLGKNTIVANNALVRHSMVGENCVIGFSTEVARSYLKSNVWLHKNYVGDSVFGDNVSLGSNAVTGNLRLDEQNIFKYVKGEKIDTQRNKLGAIIGSNVRIGINVNIMPGVRIGSGSFVGPNVNLEQDLEKNKFVKLVQNLETKENRFDIRTTTREYIKKNLK